MSNGKQFHVRQFTMYKNLEKNQEAEISFTPVIVYYIHLTNMWNN